LAGAANERLALPVFVFARSFADEHERRGSAPHAEDDLRTCRVQRTFDARHRGRFEVRPLSGRIRCRSCSQNGNWLCGRGDSIRRIYVHARKCGDRHDRDGGQRQLEGADGLDAHRLFELQATQDGAMKLFCRQGRRFVWHE
jgi:hypothetical protein